MAIRRLVVVVVKYVGLLVLLAKVLEVDAAREDLGLGLPPLRRVRERRRERIRMRVWRRKEEEEEE